MTAWDIDPGGVWAALAPIKEHVLGADGLAGRFTSLAGHIDQADAAADSMPVNSALTAFVATYKPVLTGMAAKATGCVKGATTATRAYVDGDLEMAREAQRNAAKAPAPRIGR
ncbi:DUF6507 family protein [Actinomadura rifamycini]|uniref:DUF6507 family protein n=1 Tax=Actinomadura rifamycini TaxID=31962 RepID=UPI000403F594|nr:DUF6507 family protein [Actinomadura rifamycini]